MMTNEQMAQVVAQRLSERVMEDFADLIADLTTDVLLENGIEPNDGDEAWDMLMDISSRIYIGSN